MRDPIKLRMALAQVEDALLMDVSRYDHKRRMVVSDAITTIRQFLEEMDKRLAKLEPKEGSPNVGSPGSRPRHPAGGGVLEPSPEADTRGSAAVPPPAAGDGAPRGAQGSEPNPRGTTSGTRAGRSQEENQA